MIFLQNRARGAKVCNHKFGGLGITIFSGRLRLIFASYQSTFFAGPAKALVRNVLQLESENNVYWRVEFYENSIRVMGSD